MLNRLFVYILFFVSLADGAAAGEFHQFNHEKKNSVIIVKTAIADDQLTAEWKDALQTRMSKESIDSFGNIKRGLSSEELSWQQLIISRAGTWNTFRDSLSVPFRDIVLKDTIFVFLGYLGVDDGFTYGSQTICLDITALFRAYGKADLPENSDRVNRIFAHEYTHLLHKAWASKMNYKSVTFKDSILWECLYEGIGMYRSLNNKWWPVNHTFPAVTQEALDELYPVFADRIITIQKKPFLSEEEKEKLHANLSRGPVHKKWGAFPVAIWLFREARGDDNNLVKWINEGPNSVIQLARKYLPLEMRTEFLAVFPE